jgi:hypothetical protein
MAYPDDRRHVVGGNLQSLRAEFVGRGIPAPALGPVSYVT